jgi:hypothetical protein
MLCEISSSHGGDYDVQNCLLGCTATTGIIPDDGGSTHLNYFTRQYIPEDNSEQLHVSSCWVERLKNKLSSTIRLLSQAASNG